MISRHNSSPKICPKFPPISVPVQIPNTDGQLVVGTEIRPVLCFRSRCEWFCEEHQVCHARCKYLHIAEFCDPFECMDDDDGELVL